MQNKELKELIKSQVKSKVSELSTWKNVRWEGGRLFYETQRILNEISDYNIDIKILYLETLLNEKFMIQDNWPHEAPDITQDLKNWLAKTISGLKIKNLELTNEFLEKKYGGIIFLDSAISVTLDGQM